jgi:hypothetical protein
MQVTKNRIQEILGAPFEAPTNLPFKPVEPDYSFLAEYEPFSIKKHALLADKLYKVINSDKIFNEQSRVCLPALGTLCRALCRALKISTRKTVLIESSIMEKFRSLLIDDGCMRLLGIYLASNIDILKRDMIIYPTLEPKEAVWTPLYIKDIRDVLENTYSKSVSIYIESGLKAGSTINKTMSTKQLRYIANMLAPAGCTPPHFMDAVLLRFSALTDYKGGRLRIAEPKESASQREWNRRYLNIRLQKEECPYGSLVPCSKCVKGRDQCVVAVYKITEEKQDG